MNLTGQSLVSEAGKLFVFEGPDGVGKSSLASWFTSKLQASGTNCQLLSFPGRELGTLGHHIYDLHHEPARFGIRELSVLSLQLLHVAAHLDAITNRIKPLLSAGKTVVLDRFWWSTYVYGLVGGAPTESLDQMIALERSVWRPVMPARLFLVKRESPLRPEPPEHWLAWTEAYSVLARRELASHPVSVIANDGEESDAQHLIVRSFHEQ